MCFNIEILRHDDACTEGHGAMPASTCRIIANAWGADAHRYRRVVLMLNYCGELCLQRWDFPTNTQLLVSF